MERESRGNTKERPSLSVWVYKKYWWEMSEGKREQELKETIKEEEIQDFFLVMSCDFLFMHFHKTFHSLSAAVIPVLHCYCPCSYFLSLSWSWWFVMMGGLIWLLEYRTVSSSSSRIGSVSDTITGLALLPLLPLPVLYDNDFVCRNRGLASLLYSFFSHFHFQAVPDFIGKKTESKFLW